MRKKNLKNFKLTKNNQLIFNCKVNTINGKFILDTGASHSCINYLYAEKFKINPTQSLEKASSVTSEINKPIFKK